MNNRTLLLIVLISGILVVLALQKGLPVVLFLPLVVPLLWSGRKE